MGKLDFGGFWIHCADWNRITARNHTTGVCMKYKFLAVLAIGLMACQTFAPHPVNHPKVAGQLEIRFDLDQQKATAFWQSSRLTTQAVQTTSQIGIAPNGLPLGFVSDTSTSTDFISAKFNVSNLTATAFNDLTLVAYHKDGNQSNTAIRDIVNFAGAGLNFQAFAQGIKPVNMVNASLTLDAGNEDVQFLTETEVADLQAQAAAAGEISLALGEYLFPYGYVTRATGSSVSRLLAVGSNTGILNIAIRIPNNNPAPNNTVRRFSMTFVAFDDPVVARVSESREEQGAGSGATARVASFSALRLAALQNSPLHTTTDGTQVNVCQVRTAGSATTPLTYLDTSTLSTTSGSRDTCFAAGGKRVFLGLGNSNSPAGQQLVRQADGKLVVLGIVEVGVQTDFSVVRYNPDGSLDTTFGTNGQVITDFAGANDSARAIALDNNQKIIVVGMVNSQFAVARYTSNGVLDTTFDTDGKVTTTIGSGAAALAVAVDSTNKIVAVGSSSLGSTIAKYNIDGSLDTGFDGDGILTTGSGAILDTAASVLIDGSNKIVVGNYPTASPAPTFSIMKFNSDGTPDTSFNGTGFVMSPVISIAMQFDSLGRIIVVGADNQDFAVARYTASGVLDTTFDVDGKTTIDFAGLNDRGATVAIDSSNRILLGGTINIGTSTQKSGIARLNIDGTLDTSFASSGLLTEANVTTVASGNDINTGAWSSTSILTTPTNKIIVTGFIPTAPPAFGYAASNFILLEYNP
jgi:uncharacterized delta-60 repeat protein